MSQRSVLGSESYKGFTIRKIQERGVVKYVADSGRKFNSRKRVRCESREEAVILCGQWKAVLDDDGRKAWDLSEADRIDAKRAIELKTTCGLESMSLLDIVSNYNQLRPKVEDLKLDELREGFLTEFAQRVEKVGKSQRTLLSYRNKTKVLVDAFPDQYARLLDGEKVFETLLNIQDLKGWSAGTVDSYISAWKAFFTYCRSKKQMVACPLSEESIADRIKKHTEQGALAAPVIPAISDSRNLMLEAWRARDRGMLQAIIVLLYGGLRPNAEMLLFEWSKYDPTGNLHVGGDRSKNEGSARKIEICPVAIEWMDYAKGYLAWKLHQHKEAVATILDKKQKEGKLCEEDRIQLRDLKLKEPHLVTTVRDEHGQDVQALRFKPLDWPRNWPRVRKAAGITKWVEDSTRHGWASYSFGLHGDADLLRKQLGHCDKRMLNHYLQVNQSVRKKAKDYFSLDPKTVLPPDDYQVYLKELEIMNIMEVAG